jgi:L-threonylcarbamoyladenylate synthase
MSGEPWMSGRRRVDLRVLGAADAPGLAARIRDAGLVCFPTDTVYGIGGVLSPAVAEALVVAKGRDPGKPLQVVFPSTAALAPAVAPSPRLLRACLALLPGPVTIVMPYPRGWTCPVPGEVEWGGEEAAVSAVATLGVRVPLWPDAASVMAALELPLLASSANPGGAPAPASLDEVDGGLLARCDLVLDAGRVGGTASTVVDLSRYAETGRWRLLRAGVWGEAEVAARLAGTEKEPPTP